MGTSGVTFESAISSGTLSQQILQDKQYGYMRPKNGIITYAILNGDVELTEKQVLDAVYRAFYKWMVHTKIDFVQVSPKSNPDITIRFSTEEQDENLDPQTIAYMGYPMFGNVFWGVCVINKRFVYSLDGNPISGRRMVELGFQVQFPDGQYSTVDLDVVLYHEFGHGVFGLPHDPEPDNGMAYRYDLMSELPSFRDVARATAKAPARNWPARFKEQVLKWLHRWSDS